MSQVKLSQRGLALILLENEINNNRDEVLRLTRRLEEAKINLLVATHRLNKNQLLFEKAQVVYNDHVN